MSESNKEKEVGGRKSEAGDQKPEVDVKSMEVSAEETKLKQLQEQVKRIEDEIAFYASVKGTLEREEAKRRMMMYAGHPLMKAILSMIRHWREEAIEMHLDERLTEAQFRWTAGQVDGLRRVEQGIMDAIAAAREDEVTS
jgi:hypothetical protein